MYFVFVAAGGFMGLVIEANIKKGFLIHAQKQRCEAFLLRARQLLLVLKNTSLG